MKLIKNILIAFAFISITLVANNTKAQDVYKLNADTLRITNDYYLLAKTDGNIVYYTFSLREFHSEFENLYFKDFVNKSGSMNFKTIAFNDGQEVIYAFDKKYSTHDVLFLIGTARKMTKTENFRFSESEKQNFVIKAKEKNNK